jgi:predicted PurR-regulated permease PerM
MPNPILWGAMAAVLNFAPYVGPAISLGIITLAAIISMDTLTEAFFVPGVVLIINIIEGEFISHQVIGKRLALSPVVVFISIVFWGWLWGIAGALMAIPIIAAINVVCQKIDAFKPFSNFISESNDL